jgi:hypothetical protein
MAIGLPFAVHNGLSVPPKDYEAPPPSYIMTLSQVEMVADDV